MLDGAMSIDSRDVDDDRVEATGAGGLDQDLVEVRLEVVGLEAEREGGVGLGIHVDDQDAVALLGERAGEVHRRRRLPAAAFLIHDGDDTHDVPPRGVPTATEAAGV